jgi:hypothetical protein
MAASIDAVTGTKGQMVAGPSILRPGPFGWNCLTSKDAKEGSTAISITSLQWGSNMGKQHGISSKHKSTVNCQPT